MIKYRISGIFILLLALFAWSCSKDEVSPSSKNTLTLDGTSFDVSMVSLMGVSIEEEGHAGITFTSTEGTKVKTLSVNIEYSPAEEVGGSYAFPETIGSRLLNGWLTNYTELNGASEVNSTQLEKGNVTVKDNGDSNFTITIDLEMTDGKVFKGTYQGAVKEIYNNR